MADFDKLFDDEEQELRVMEEAVREQAKARASEDKEVDKYMRLIQQTMWRYWKRPPSARKQMEATLRIYLLPGGELQEATIIKGSGHDSFDRSALNAVREVGQFPVPSDSIVFDRNFRVFTMRFRPVDLRD